MFADNEDYTSEEGFSTEPYLNGSEYNLTSPAPTNATADWTHQMRIIYIVIPSTYVLLCLIATLINLRILLAIHWIKRPLSPTLIISLSLTLADTISAFLIGVGLTINSLLPKGFDIFLENQCFYLVLEAFRLSGILVSTVHLFVLAANHYFGILCPFRSITWLTHRKLTAIMIFVWVAPTVYIFGYFSSIKDQAFQTEDCAFDASTSFLTHQKFRKIFSSIFFFPLLIMCGIYIHISFIVRRHQANRRRYTRHSRRHNNAGNNNNQARQFDLNLKAIWTSILILSTYILCFMPAVMIFYLICNDCHYDFQSIGLKKLIFISSVTNLLLITKYLVNPLIYAARMHEIQVAIKLMTAAYRRRLRRLWYQANDDELQGPNEVPPRPATPSRSYRRNAILMRNIQGRSNLDTSTRRLQTTSL